jgi:polysaccharide pyruvyl transferase WcaK-like protein
MAFFISGLPATEITSIINRITFPLYSKIKCNAKRISQVFLEVYNANVTLIVYFFGAIFTTSNYFVPIILGKDWISLIEPLKILSVYGMIRGIGSNYAPVYKALGKVDLSFKLSILKLLIMGVLIYPLTLTYGINGVAYSVLIPSLISFFIGLVNMSNLLSISFFEILTQNLILFATVIISILTTNFFTQGLSLNLISLIILSILYSLIFGVHLLISKQFYKNFYDSIKDFIRTRYWKYLDVKDYLLTSLSNSQVLIHGSYSTANIGDLTIGYAIKQEIEKRFNLKCDLTGRYYKFQKTSKYPIYIVGGGGIVHDFYKNNIEKRMFCFGKSNINVALGVGVPGFQSNKGKKLAKKMDEADLITVRDARSKKILDRLLNCKIYQTACPSLLINTNKLPNLKIKSNKPKCGINLRDWFTPQIPPMYFKNVRNPKLKREEYLNFIKKILKRLKSEYDLYFIPFTPQDHQFAVENLCRFKINILKFSDPYQTLSTVKSMDKMICTRYHSIIFSIIFEKPMYVINYLPKASQLSAEFEFSGKDITDLNQVDEKFAFTERAKVERANLILKKRAEQNFSLFGKVIKKRL